MLAGRRWSVERHVKKKHNGQAQVTTFEEYSVGVRSGSRPAPNYRYERTNLFQLKNSRIIDPTNMIIAFEDIQDTWWKDKLSTTVKNMLKRGQPDIHKIPGLIRVERSGLLLLSVGSFICHKCNAIGITSDEYIARDIINNSHQCPIKYLVNPPVHNPEILQRLEHERVALLFEVIKALAGENPVILKGLSEEDGRVGLNIVSPPKVEKPEWLKGIVQSRDEWYFPNDGELWEFLCQCGGTASSCVNLHDGRGEFPYTIVAGILDK